MYKTLAGGVGVPFVRWFDMECDDNAMVIDLLCPSLEDLFNFCNQKFSLETVLLLADQLVWSCSLVIFDKLSPCFRFHGSSTSTRATSFTTTRLLFFWSTISSSRHVPRERRRDE